VQDFTYRLIRLFQRSPHQVAFRVFREFKKLVEFILEPFRERYWNITRIAKQFNVTGASQLWIALTKNEYPVISTAISGDAESVSPSDRKIILQEASKAKSRTVEFLGSGPIELGEKIDWAKDYKSGFRWSNHISRTWKYNDLDNPSDVKFPWELSRMQWLIPVGQSYLLSGDESDSAFVKSILEDWIDNNPIGTSITWACTMDVAIRATTWTWLFHVFSASAAWQDVEFQRKFTVSLFHHGLYVHANLELSDVNGNHLLTNAAGMMFLGYFFQGSLKAKTWVDKGRELLETEMELQVFPDGVDHEGSIPYHRLACELFLFPALFAQSKNQPFSVTYLQRLNQMAEFTAAYSRPDSLAPLIGDADDGRFLPFGNQDLNDHTYLLPICERVTGISNGGISSLSSKTEVFFWGSTMEMLRSWKSPREIKSELFPHGGFIVLRNSVDHVIVDSGPLGLQGRGGHGHNDALSVDAFLCDTHILVDSGSYLYTADYRSRNQFRSTAFHNTPMVDDQEINRFVHEKLLWSLHDDARPEVTHFESAEEFDSIRMKHHGYERLENPVVVMRAVTLEHQIHCLRITDSFQTTGSHKYVVPYRLAPGINAEIISGNAVSLDGANCSFILRWMSSVPWSLEVGDTWLSPSYGVRVPTQQILFRRFGLAATLEVEIKPR